MQVSTVVMHIVLVMSMVHICLFEGWIEVYTELLLYGQADIIGFALQDIMIYETEGFWVVKNCSCQFVFVDSTLIYPSELNYIVIVERLKQKSGWLLLKPLPEIILVGEGGRNP